MKQLFLPALAFAAIAFVPIAMSAQNFFAADKLALNTPPSKTTSVKKLAEYLCDEQPNEVHKARALYAWVTLNISYVDSTDEREIWATPYDLKRESPEQVLKNRTALCQGYANLLCALMAEAGLLCEVVAGLVKNSQGEVAQIGHAWVAARIAGEWRLFDPTWGVPPAGMLRWEVQDEQFMAEPKDFLLKHLPDDPVWQLLENPVSEQQFRESSDKEIMTFLETETDGEFKFSDTLSQWVSMDSVSRIFASESRVLRFNGSNERVVFGLGQRYWGLFFELHIALDSLARVAILTDTVEIDTLRFESEINLMTRYHDRARMLFSRLQTKERLEKAAKFYTEQDVAAIFEKTKGDMRAGVFTFLLHSMPKEDFSEGQMAQLKYQQVLSRRAYTEAEKMMDCSKMANACFNVSLTKTFLAIKMAKRQTLFAEQLSTERSAAKNLPTIERQLREARALFFQSIENCERMRQQPFQFAFVQDLVLKAQQGLLTLRNCEIRAARTALTPEIEEALTAQNFNPRKAETLLAKMSRVAKSMEAMKDTLLLLPATFGAEFVQTALTKLHLEQYAHQYNLANFRYGLSIDDYNKALSQNDLKIQKEAIRAKANQAMQELRIASKALDFLEDSGVLASESIDQKQMKVNKLSKALREFLNDL